MYDADPVWHTLCLKANAQRQLSPDQMLCCTRGLNAEPWVDRWKAMVRSSDTLEAALTSRHWEFWCWPRSHECSDGLFRCWASFKGGTIGFGEALRGPDGTKPESGQLAWNYLQAGKTPFPSWARVNIGGVFFLAVVDRSTGAYAIAAPFGADGLAFVSATNSAGERRPPDSSTIRSLLAEKNAGQGTFTNYPYVWDIQGRWDIGQMVPRANRGRSLLADLEYSGML
eukprot:gnl/TRDRNA2_/TRDRNA2_91403_c0_seq1.p1 gnl/TRDRNA2_/TRDRNA2_91403_c0~~gnl/TRDRNA2_/TRDRNA2_91403_c0_seq1.p1  ORF type:complete len:256 (+),score=14.52 gnl/TRDRNA2_/TRDRNA2_91403_c0_seq1:88-768(+)